MSFEGTLVAFSSSELLTALTTGMVLLSTATAIVVSLALYVFKHKDKYLLQMFQFTEDMSDYNALKKDKVDVTSFTGEKLLSSQQNPFSTQDITEILIDMEIRLNRIDGRDPRMAFLDDECHKKQPEHQNFRGKHLAQEKAFFGKNSE